jgi:hypothetical protein
MNTREAAPHGVDALAGNVFWYCTDARGRISVDFALVADPELFWHRFSQWWVSSGGQCKRISKLQYAIMKAQDLRQQLN